MATGGRGMSERMALGSESGGAYSHEPWCITSTPPPGSPRDAFLCSGSFDRPVLIGLRRGDSQSRPRIAIEISKAPDISSWWSCERNWRDRPSSRSEEHTSELQSLMRISYAVFCLKKKKKEHQDRYQKQVSRVSAGTDMYVPNHQLRLNQ